MRVLLVNRFFGETPAPTGRLAGDVAAALAARGTPESGHAVPRGTRPGRAPGGCAGRHQ